MTDRCIDIIAKKVVQPSTECYKSVFVVEVLNAKMSPLHFVLAATGGIIPSDCSHVSYRCCVPSSWWNTQNPIQKGCTEETVLLQFRALYVQEKNREPLFIVAVWFRTLDGSKLSERTIRRILYKSGIRSYVAASKPFLSAKHIAARLN